MKIRAPLPTLALAISSLTILAVTAFTPTAAWAAPPPSEIAKVVENAAHDLSEHRPSEAIRALEAAADRGATHPDLSFNRGLGYLRRGTSTTPEPGDLGQAAAGFAETLRFRPDDAEATRALERAQLLSAKRKPKKDASSENLSLGLGERVLLRLSPMLLFIIAALGSATLTGGLLARRSDSESRRVGGNIAIIVGCLLLLPTFALERSRNSLFRDARVAVVILDGTEVLDQGGGRISGSEPLREGTIVYIRPPEAGLAKLISFRERGYVSPAQLRILAGPSH